jgi:heptosyltransferase III
VQSPRGKILVIRGGAIGDFILTLPVIAALRKQFPDAHLEVLGYPHIVQLARAAGLVDQVQPIEARALAGFFARDGILSEDLSDYFSQFSIIVSFLFDPDKIFQTNVARSSKAQFIAGPHRPNEAERVHATKVYLKALERLAIFEADHLPQLTLNSSLNGRGGLSVDQDGRRRVPTIAVHPGSGSEKKNWPEENWEQLLNHMMQSTQMNLLLVGGEAEGERLQRLAAALPSARTRVAQSLPLAKLAGELQNCSAFIGHDSGISHLAAAVGLPGLLLWGDTTEEIWRPPHEKISILKKAGGVKKIAVEEVVRDLEKLRERQGI